MPIRTIVTGVVAVFLGLIAVLLVRNYLNPGAKPGAAAAPTAPVVVASQPIARGVTLTAPVLKVARYPADSVPPGAFTNINDVVGTGANARAALRSLVPGEPILAPKISGPGLKLALSLAVTPGMRAVSLRSNDVAGVAGFVLPGDRVDILLTRNGNNSNEGAATQVLAQNIRVLAVDQIDSDETDKPVVAKAITIEVNPDQAQRISLAQSVGGISLALRHVSDDGALKRRVTSISELAVLSAPVLKPRAINKNMAEVRVTRGVDTAAYEVVRP